MYTTKSNNFSKMVEQSVDIHILYLHDSNAFVEEHFNVNNIIPKQEDSTFDLYAILNRILVMKWTKREFRELSPRQAP